MNYPAELTETYEIYEQIGAGGGGVVYRAMHKRLKKMVVLKRIKGGISSLVKNRTEVDILKNLRHSYLPQVIDFIECPEGVFTVMDYIPGKSLQQMLSEGHSFTEKEVLKYTNQLSEALAYLHFQDPPIVHGDIKPDNIMITPEGNVCLIDFNISGMFEGGGVQTFGYTPGFSSPEQKEAFEAARAMYLAQEEQYAATLLLSREGQYGETLLLPREGEDTSTLLLPGEGESEKTIQLFENGQDKETLLLPDERKEVTIALSGGTEETISLEKGKNNKGSTKKMISTKNNVRKPPAFVPQKIECSSDIYSLGATLYTLLTGKILEPGGELVLPVSDGFAAILSKMLAKSPNKRYPDAGKLKKALSEVYKKDKGYRRLVLCQNLTFAGILCAMAISVLCIIFGKQRMEREQLESYDQLVAEMGDGAEMGLALEAFDVLYDKAVGMYPEDVRAYYAKAYYLHETAGETEALRYMEGFLGRRFEGHDGELGNLYYLAAECYFRQENYIDACQYYEQSIRLRGDNPEVYRDYAISLVYIGRNDKAEETLTQAIEAGMEQADIDMVRGELARNNGKFEEAVDCFAQVLARAQDEYLRQRAYIMASKAFCAIGTAEALLEDVEWLNQAAAELGMTYRLLIYEALVRDYIALGEQTGENSYFPEAVRVLELIVENHWDTYTTYSNLIVLNQRNGELQTAVDWGQKMTKAYPERYVTWMRMAFLEIDRQKVLAAEERDYTEFAAYYQKAKELAKEQLKGNVTDAELLMLDNAYAQVADGGWLGE